LKVEGNYQCCWFYW